MKAKLISNPYIVYAGGFLLILLLYPLHWSYLYPHLSVSLFLFIGITALVSIIIGLAIHKTNYLSYREISYRPFILWVMTILVWLSYLVECAYMRVIPLFAILRGGDYDYKTFGIPTFHVLLVTFNSFWTVFIFHNYLSQRRKSLLICYILSLLPAVLIFNRGMLLLNLASSFFVLFMSVKHLKKLIVRVTIFLFALLFLFGLAGNIRVTQGESVNDVILAIGQATDEFKESAVPKEFFWSYLYITSPLANVQETINDHYISTFTSRKLGIVVNRTFLPDFISKRIEYFSHPIEHVNQISPSFTVGTVYGTSYAYLGWWGMFLMFLYIILFNFVIIFCLSKNSIFFVTGIAILDCMMLFNTFDNMFSFSGLSMQLFYPLLFGLFSNVRFTQRLTATA